MPGALGKVVAVMQKQVLDGMCVLLLAGVLVVVTFQVLNRFLLSIPAAWSEEAARYLFVWLSLLGAVRGVRDRSHLQVDLFVQMLSSKLQRVLDIVAGTLVAVLLVAVIQSAIILLPLTWTRRISTMNIPIFYLYVAIPISMALMLLFTVRNTIKGPGQTR